MWRGLAVVTVGAVLGVVRADEEVTTTTQFATLDPEIYDLFIQFLPEDYEVTNNVYSWNVSEIITLLNQSDPTLVCSAPREIWATFPVDVLVELPLWAKRCHEFWCLANETEWIETYNITYESVNANCSNGVGINVDGVCPYPLVDTDRWGSFEPCGLACSYANLLHGFTPSIMDALDTTKWFMFGLSSMFLSIMAFNLLHPGIQERKYQPFCQRPLLNQSTMLITICYAIVILSIILTEFIGKDEVLCASNGSRERVVSLGNPRAGWAPCTIFGFAFYVAILLLSWYTAVFSVALWNNFSDPFNKRIQVLEKWMSERNLTTVYEWTFQWPPFIHICLISLATLVLAPISIAYDVYDAYHPFGVCFSGGGGKRSLIFWLDVFPLFLPMLIIAGCLAHGMFLLYKQKQKSSHKKTWAGLQRRIGFFGVCVLLSWLSVLSTILEIFVHVDDIAQSSQDRIECVFLNQGSADGCYNVGYRIPPVLIHYIYYGGILACLASMVLSFHSRAISWWAENVCQSCNQMGWCDMCLKAPLITTLKSLPSGTNGSRSGKSGEQNSVNHSSKTDNTTTIIDSKTRTINLSTNVSSDGENGLNSTQITTSTPVPPTTPAGDTSMVATHGFGEAAPGIELQVTTSIANHSDFKE